LFEIVRLSIVPAPFSMPIPWGRALVSVLFVIDTVPLTLEVVKAPELLRALLLSSYCPAAPVPTLSMKLLDSVKFVAAWPSMPLRAAFLIAIRWREGLGVEVRGA